MAQLKDLLVNGDAKFLADVILDHDPTANLHAATKAYVDAQVSTGSDEKLKVGALTSGTEYLPILAIATDSGTAATRQIDKNAQAFKYICTPGASGAATKGTAELILGNGLSEGYANAASGALTIFGTGIYGVTLKYGGGYTGQTLYLPNPTAGNQTNYLVSKSVANGVGAVDQPVYVDANGQIAVANKNPWNVSANNGIYFDNNKNVATTGLKEGSLSVLDLQASDISGITTGQAGVNIYTDVFQVNLSASHAAGSTTYTINQDWHIGPDNTVVDSILQLSFFSRDGKVAQKPTSASIASNVVTLTFATSLNPSQAISKIYISNTDSGYNNFNFGNGINSTGYITFNGGNSVTNTAGHYSITYGQHLENNGSSSAVFGSKNKNTAGGSLVAGRENINAKDGAFIAGRGHDSSNGPLCVAAVGQYSSIVSTSGFVVGNGTADNARSNAFEVTTTGEAKAVSFTENGTSLVSKYAAISHTHSDSTGITIASSDKIAIFDASDSYKLKSALSFDTTVSDQWLCKNGTWSAPTGLQPGSHSHGHVQNDGTMSDSTGTAVATGDKLVITQSNGTLSTSSISFDTTNTNKVLTQAGTWVTLETSTDEKVAVAALTGTTETTYYPILALNGATTAATRQIDSSGNFSYKIALGTTSATGTAILTIGNNLNGGATKVTNNAQGTLRIYGSGTTYTDIIGSVPKNSNTLFLPTHTGSAYLVAADVGSGVSGLGSTTQPVYINNAAVAQTCTTYAGGTALTVNGTSKSGNTASIYAPESAPTASTGYWVGYTSGTGAAWKKLSPAIATESTTSGTSLSFGSKYKITVGGESAYFTMPGDPNTNYYHSAGSWSGLTYTFGKVGSPGDIAITLPTGTTSTTVALGNHTHVLSLAETTNTPDLAITFNKAYQITGGGNTFVFTTPQLPTIPTISLNESSTTSPSFYAPTSAGSSGYVLQSNGSGAPTWVDVGTITGDTKVTQTTVTGTSTTSLYPILLAYGTGQTATTTNTANFTANASISPSGDLWVNKATSSTTFNYGANAYTQYNSTLKAIEFCFA